MSPAEILAAIDDVCRRGGSVIIEGDHLGSDGAEVTVRLATPWRAGPEVHVASGRLASRALASALSRAVRR